MSVAVILGRLGKGMSSWWSLLRSRVRTHHSESCAVRRVWGNHLGPGRVLRTHLLSLSWGLDGKPGTRDCAQPSALFLVTWLSGPCSLSYLKSPSHLLPFLAS